MKKYIGIIILITLQLITILSFTQSFDLESVIGVWVLIYLYVFYRKVFRLEGDISVNVGGSYDSVKGYMKVNELNNNNKESRYSLKYINTKWVYLVLSVTNAVICYILIKV